MNFKKIILFVALCTVFSIKVPRASANTIDVQAQINAIITQIASLKLQLADLTGNTMLGSDNNTPTNNLVPTITSISPSPVIVGGAGRSYTVTGTGFVSGSVVNLNGSARLTTYTSATQLSVYLPYTDIAAAGTFNITVANPNIVGTSNSIQFTVSNSAPPALTPAITSISPSSSTVGDSSLTTITVNGTNFVQGSSVLDGTTQLATIYVSSTQLTAQTGSYFNANAGSFNITVHNPAPNEATSNAMTFTVNPPNNSMPTITSLSETEALVGSQGFYLHVFGTNFTNNSIIRWNGTDLGMGYISSTELKRFIPDSNLATIGIFTITVFNLGSSGGTSNGVSFTIINPIPVIDSISPDSVATGSSSLTLTINGTGFLSTSTVSINTSSLDSPSNLTATYVSPTQLTAIVPTSRFTDPTTFSISVTNSQPGLLSGTSNLKELSVTPTQLTIVKNTVGGDGDFTFTIASVANAQPVDFKTETIQTVRFTGSATVPELPGATYSVEETVPAGWTLNTFSCLINGSPIGTLNRANASIDGLTPQSGRTTICTFGDTKTNPDLTITNIDPDEAVVGSPDTVITINGTKFQNDSYVVASASGLVNDIPLTTTYVSSTQLTTTIPRSLLATAGDLYMSVINRSPVDSTYPVHFDVTDPNAMNNSTGNSVTSSVVANPSPITPSSTSIQTNVDIKNLQIFLNTNGFTVATSGPGSLGNETNILGPRTITALKQFQISKGLNPNSKSLGLFGPWTKAKIKEITGN